MLAFLLTNKKVISLVGILALIISGMLYFNSYKKEVFQEGYDKAVSEYQTKLLEYQRKNKKELEEKLLVMRDTLERQYREELERAASDVQIDTSVEVITEYIERKVYVKEGCDTVDPALIRVFNESISRINP